MLNFCLRTFGCKSNQYESQALREALAAAGHREVPDPEDADLLLVNTCAVTGRAGASCRNAIRRALRANPRLRVAITGCGVDLKERWPDIPSGEPLLVANADKAALPRLLEKWLAETGAGPRPEAAPAPFASGISAFQGHTRAFLKVQDGCDNFCTYCAVPLARGAPRSRPPGEILAEAARLAASGHRELVLTGINIGVYRHGATDFADLVAAIAGTPGLLRLRLGSVEPPQVTERLVRVMRDRAAVCPHLHIPLQSGSDRILAAMGRRYDARLFLERVALIRENLSRPALTTDVIVGFPGEDGEAFAESADLCRRAGFSRLHVFLFSPRPGTPAASLRRTVPDREAGRWKNELLALGDGLARDFAAGCVGLEERVIMEKAGGGLPSGLSDRYVRVELADCAAGPGEMRRVRIVGADGANLIGACVETPQP